MQSYPQSYTRTGISPAQKAKIILSESPNKPPEKEKKKKLITRYLVKDWSPIYPNTSLLTHSFRPYGFNYGAYYNPFY